MLRNLRHYLQSRPFSSLGDIALHLDVDPEVARSLISRWQAKGRIKRLDRETRCGSCAICPSGSRELYRWVEE